MLNDHQNVCQDIYKYELVYSILSNQRNPSVENCSTINHITILAVLWNIICFKNMQLVHSSCVVRLAVSHLSLCGVLLRCNHFVTGVLYYIFICYLFLLPPLVLALFPRYSIANSETTPLQFEPLIMGTPSNFVIKLCQAEISHEATC